MAQLEQMRITRPGFAVRDVSFSIPRGAVVGLVGPNGAGKTSIIRALLGLIVPDSGRVELLGESAGSVTALASTGVVLDQSTAAADWKVASLTRRLAPFYSRWDEELFLELLEKFDIPQRRRVGELSRGQGVKLSLASALAQRPELLILDEPSSGLDPASRREVGDEIRQFMLDPRHGVLLSTHITTDLENLADELIVLVAGRVAHHGPLHEAKEAFAVARGTGPAPAGTLGPQYSGGQWSALIHTHDSALFGPDILIDDATIDDLIVHLGVARNEVSA